MDQLYKEIVSFQFKVNDQIDDHSHAIAKTLKREVQQLEDEVQTRKNPRSVEHRVKGIIQILEQAGHAEVMSHEHVHHFVHECEDFRKKLQQLF